MLFFNLGFLLQTLSAAEQRTLNVQRSDTPSHIFHRDVQLSSLCLGSSYMTQTALLLDAKNMLVIQIYNLHTASYLSYQAYVQNLCFFFNDQLENKAT